jgi:protein TonB
MGFCRLRISKIEIRKLDGRNLMFNNLIESSSHRQEFKRRGSFLLFTTGTYVVLFVLTGVISIYAYDARLEDQNLEVVTLLPPIDIAAPQEDHPRVTTTSPRNDTTHQAFDIRRVAMAPLNQPQAAPTEISTHPNPDLPFRPGVPTVIGDHEVNADLPGSANGTSNSKPGTGSVNIGPELGAPPPTPAPVPPVKKIVKASMLLNSIALSLPKPPYPPLAKQLRIQGMISVQVLIDETGKVISAKAVSGSPFLTVEAQKAALQARFSPAILGEQPVKVSGIITYNFVLQ